MAEAAPTIYLLHGDDDLAISEALEKIQSKFEDSATAELNTTRLDGRIDSLEDLAAVVSALPFLANRRLVIFEHPLARLQGASGQHKKFIEILESVPPTTALVLVERSPLLDYKGEWLKGTRWIGKWFEKTGKRTFLRTFPLPRGGGMVQWIIERTSALGGSITPQAASTLAGLTGENTRMADQEILKLLDYVNFSRSVDIDDVQALTPDAAEVDDFALVEALRRREARKAQAVLHRKLEEEEPNIILGSMIYQFRLLLLAREIIDQGGNQQDVIDQLAQFFKVSYYPAKLAHENAFRFSPQALHEIYHNLLDIDEAIKTGKMPADLALDLFTLQVTN